VDQARRPPRRDRQPDRPREAEQVRDHGQAAPGEPRPPRRVALSTPLFRFVQFEFPWELGPPPGRYLLRDVGDEAALRVVVVATLGAPERRLIGRRRARAVDPEPEPTPVTTTRVTIVRGQPVDETAARAFLEHEHDAVDDELAVLNRLLHLHRVAAVDASVREVALPDALAVRVGFGEGEQVADGRWTEAIEPGERRAPRGRRVESMRPQERLAALLGGRDAPLAAEELALRARADLGGGRVREAALQLRVALEAALAELEAWRERGDLAQRLEQLREERGAVGAAANAALRGGLDEDAAADVERALERVEAALRARAASGLNG
jgi:hypothetical protein